MVVTDSVYFLKHVIKYKRELTYSIIQDCAKEYSSMGRLDLQERAVAGHMTGMSRKARKSSDIAGLGLHLQLYSYEKKLKSLVLAKIKLLFNFIACFLKNIQLYN